MPIENICRNVKSDDNTAPLHWMLYRLAGVGFNNNPYSSEYALFVASKMLVNKDDVSSQLFINTFFKQHVSLFGNKTFKTYAEKNIKTKAFQKVVAGYFK